MAIRVLVAGALGKMGAETVRAAAADPELKLVAAVARRAVGQDVGEVLLNRRLGAPIHQDAAEAIARHAPDVLVDFTTARSAVEHVQAAVAAGVNPVVGTTGLTADELEKIRTLCARHGLGGAVIPNFSVGAALLIRLAEQVVRFFPDVELIELHHDEKLDYPSGTAMLTCQRLARARTGAQAAATRPAGPPLGQPVERAAGARGAEVEGIRVHSVRLPGLIAHHQLLFGGPGQILSLRHDSTSRASFMPGLVLTIKRVRGFKGVAFSLEDVLEL